MIESIDVKNGPTTENQAYVCAETSAEDRRKS